MEDACGGLINQVGGREMEKGDGAFRMWGGREQTNEKGIKRRGRCSTFLIIYFLLLRCAPCVEGKHFSYSDPPIVAVRSDNRAFVEIDRTVLFKAFSCQTNHPPS